MKLLLLIWEVLGAARSHFSKCSGTRHMCYHGGSVTRQPAKRATSALGSLKEAEPIGDIIVLKNMVGALANICTLDY